MTGSLVSVDEDGDDDGLSFELASGASHEMRVRFSPARVVAIDPASSTVPDDDDEDAGPLSISLAADETVTVPQDCVSAFGTAGEVSCGSGSTAPAFSATLRSREDETVRWEIRDEDDEVVASGTPAYDPAGAAIAATLPRAGGYVYQSYVSGDPSPREQVVFEALRCVTAKATCQGVSFTNPRGNAPVAVYYGYEDGDLLDERVVVSGGRTAKVGWRDARLGWFAVDAVVDARDPGSAPDVVGTAGGPVSLDVPQDCTPGGVSAGGADSGAGARLAATGSGPADAGLLLAGLLLLLGSAAVLRRRTLSR